MPNACLAQGCRASTLKSCRKVLCVLLQAAESALAGSTQQQQRLEEALRCLIKNTTAAGGEKADPVPLYEPEEADVTQQPAGEVCLRSCSPTSTDIIYVIGPHVHASLTALAICSPMPGTTSCGVSGHVTSTGRC